MSAYTASIFSFSTSETAFQARASASTICYFNDSKLSGNKRAKAASAGPIRVNNILMRISADSRPTTLILFYRFHFDSFITTLWSPAKAHEQAKKQNSFLFSSQKLFSVFPPSIAPPATKRSDSIGGALCSFDFITLCYRLEWHHMR